MCLKTLIFLHVSVYDVPACVCVCVHLYGCVCRYGDPQLLNHSPPCSLRQVCHLNPELTDDTAGLAG